MATNDIASHRKEDFVIEETARYILQKIRNRERYHRTKDKSPTAVWIIEDLGADTDILVRSINNHPGPGADLLGVYEGPSEEMIRDDLMAFYG